ncbi:MAG: metallophosphoesterase [Gemmatimonadota bacterium]|nr:metallophosphoesterase [Gemmatimonadota bacterium]
MESRKRIIFDKTHLPPAQFEYVVIADTHYMIDVGDRPLEFESRRVQTQRAGIALQQVSDIGADFVIHMGDLVQEYPGTPDFKRAMFEARDQIRACNISPHYVAGNHDIGDKTDPTMPTHAATAESLAFFHELFGPSWYSFDRDDCHFIVLNSQILNSKIPEADDQWKWFESDLEKHKNQRLFLFFHLPLYLGDKNEPGLGHYDNISPPDRDRLLALIEKYGIERLFAAHVHYPFYDKIGKTRYFITPSTSFTRPGFGHLYASAPPPEQGRDDTGKLGFYLLRIRAEHTDIHFIRTKGETKRPARDRLVTCTSATLSSPVGLTLRHPITPIAELPIAYPSVIRQKVRNDQHLFACIELGAKFVRFPWRDLRDPFQRTRLEMLCAEGITPIATFLEPRIASLPEHIKANLNIIQNWEIQISDPSLSSDEVCETLNRCAELAELSICPIIPNERVHGKQHLRTRMGYQLDELENLNATLQNADMHLQRVLSRVPPNQSPWTYIQSLSERKYSNIGHIDISLELDAQNDSTNARRIAEATFAIVQLPGTRLFIDPLTDFDRTMDVTHGLLDTLCNPRPPFHTLRCLNTLLNSPVHDSTFTDPAEQICENNRVLYLNNTNRQLALVLPARNIFDLNALEFSLDTSPVRIYHLRTGEVETVSHDAQIEIQDGLPILVIGQPDL